MVAPTAIDKQQKIPKRRTSLHDPQIQQRLRRRQVPAATGGARAV
jgi:hypothetical protein